MDDIIIEDDTSIFNNFFFGITTCNFQHVYAIIPEKCHSLMIVALESPKN